MAQSLALPWFNVPDKSSQVPEKTGNQRADGQKGAISKFKRGHRSWQRRNACRPAPSWQSRPYFDEGRGTRKQLSVGGLDMEALHRLLSGKPVWKIYFFFSDIDETERSATVRAAIMGNLCPT
jgi:hypothetical protein